MIKTIVGLIGGFLICSSLNCWSDEPAEKSTEQAQKTYIVAAWSDSSDSLNNFSKKILALGATGTSLKYIDGRSDWLVLFLIQDNKDFDLAPLVGKDKNSIQTVRISVDKIIVRTFMTITYENGITALNRHPSTFWIGDSSPIALPSITIHKDEVLDPDTFVPDFESCKTVTAGCLRTIISEGYLTKTAVIEGRKENPLVFLKNRLHESLALRQDNPDVGSFRISSPFSSFRSVISNISLSHQIWAYLTPSSEILKVGTFTDLTGSSIVDFNTPGFPLLKTPLRLFKASIDKQSTLNGQEMKTLTGSLYDACYKSEFIKNANKRF